MTPDELRKEPAVVTVARAAQIFGVSLRKARYMIAADEWPTRVLRFGRTVKIPTADIAALLGIPYGDDTATPQEPALAATTAMPIPRSAAPTRLASSRPGGRRLDGKRTARQPRRAVPRTTRRLRG